MEEFLRKLGIDKTGEKGLNGTYVITIDNSDDYGKYYSKLDKSQLIEEDEESSQITMETSSIQFVNDDYTITLLADFDADTYKLTIKEN